MKGRKVTIEFCKNQWQWADRQRRRAIKDFAGSVEVKHREPKEPDGRHRIYVIEVLPNEALDKQAKT